MKNIQMLKKKLLFRKKIVVLNVAHFSPNGKARECYEALLDRLLQSVSSDEVYWPEISSNPLDSLGNIVAHLMKVHNDYPGWIVPPYSSRNRACIILNMYREVLHKLIDTKDKRELDFLFEYDWIREKCLRPLFSKDVVAYESILRRNLGVSDEEQYAVLSIKLSLLRNFRENGNQRAWLTLYSEIIENKNLLTRDQYNRILYEKCLYSMYCFDYGELRKSLDEWKIDDQSPVWALRKAGLLAEEYEISQAHNLLKDSLYYVRKQLQNDDQSYSLLTQENTLMALKRYIDSVYRTDEKESYSISEEEEKINAKWKLVHRKYGIDFYTENERFVLLMEASKVPYLTREVKPSFDFGINSITNKYTDDQELLNAFAFIRFREDTGVPFRIFDCVNGDNAAAGAAERISSYSLSLAVITIIRANSEKAIDNILTRSVISQMKTEDIDSLCETYLYASKAAMSSFSKGDDHFPKDFAGLAACIFPNILSHLCCKCSLSLLDRMLEFLLEVYNSKYRNLYDVSILVKRLVRSFTYQQQIDRLKVFLNFPIFNGSLDSHRFPDPMSFITVRIDNEAQNMNSIIAIHMLNVL